MKNIVDINQDAALDLDLPFGIEGTVRWPDVDTASSPSDGSGTLTSTDTSNEFLHLDLDVDQALADIFLGGVNPFEIPFDFEVVDGTVQLIDLDLSGGLDFVQSFTLTAPKLVGKIVFENGEAKDFNTLDDIVLQDAHTYDADGDGNVEFSLLLSPDATLKNDTDLGINLGYNFDLLRVTGSYDIGVDSDTFDFAAVDEGGSLQVETTGLYNNIFDLAFQNQGFEFFV